MYSFKTDKEIIEELLTIRLFEAKLLELFDSGQINGTTHTCIGQEEIPVSIMSLLNEEDYIFSNHRGHGHYISRFNDLEGLFAEIMGKEGAVCNGVGGSQHIKRGNYFSTGIQGESIPVAVGVGIDLKRKKNNNLAIAFIGDGTWGEGAVYEALNMASLYAVPVVIICENNGISQSTPSINNLSSTIKNRANAFGINYLHFDEGSTVNQLKERINPAFNKVRKNSEPLIIEIKTKRLASHSKGDDTRSKTEIQNLINKDWYEFLKLNEEESLFEMENIISEKINSIIFKLQNSSFSQRNIQVEKYKNDLKPLTNTYVKERVLENLNRALKLIMESDKASFIIGEDILDPYGGAFKATKGLSTLYPERVISSPISELGLTGVGNGLALTGNKVIVEFMFGDFIFLAFDQIINFAAKTVSMYGKNLSHKILFRCPVGGHRGYGPTHSQSVQKFFIGIPNLDLYELSPLHDCVNILPLVLDKGIPSILFESKTLYPNETLALGINKNIFNHSKINNLVSHVFIEKNIDAIIICGGSMFYDCLEVIKKLFLEYELSVHIINPFKIYPFDIEMIKDLISKNISIFTVEEGTPGGTWGSEVLSMINSKYSNENINFHSITSTDDIIPSSKHLEELVLVNESIILKNIINKLKL